MAQHAVPGSERQPMRGARPAGEADPTERCQVSMVLRHNNAGGLLETVRSLASGTGTAAVIGREEFARRFGASRDDLDAVRRFAAAHDLQVVRADAAHRTVVLSGTVAACKVAFGVELQRFEHPGGVYRGRTGPVHLPDQVQDVVEAVLGLDNRSVARPYCRRRTPRADGGSGAATWFDPVSVAAMYGFPAGDGRGECVGIIELGGGYSAGDLAAYFAGLGINPAPRVVTVPIDGARNQPSGDPQSPDGEVMLDIEVVGAVAPAARIAVYFAANTDAGFLAALNSAVHDLVNRPSVISISWGGPEPSWTPQAMTAFDSALQGAAAMGITVCAAAGDSGSGDGDSDGGDHADFPASSPHVLACGGTTLAVENGAIVSEVSWNDAAQGGGTGGGGVSSFFALPAWQAGLNVARVGQVSGGQGGQSGQASLGQSGQAGAVQVAALTMRGVPDVCGNADPETGYAVRIDGANTVMGGTSAVAPLWAGLLARVNATRGRPVGFVNPALYRAPGGLRDITQGNNGDYAAAPGWDACTGLGSPDGAKTVAVVTATA